MVGLTFMFGLMNHPFLSQTTPPFPRLFLFSISLQWLENNPQHLPNDSDPLISVLVVQSSAGASTKSHFKNTKNELRMHFYVLKSDLFPVPP